MHKIYDFPNKSPERRKLRLDIVKSYQASGMNVVTFCKINALLTKT